MTYRIPANTHRVETVVVNSRFITTVARVSSVHEVKALLNTVRAEMPDANHHVYAFRVGHGNSVIEGMSDDGEPSGTSGPPTLAVLRGSELGDVLLVTTRYFGGTKLGTGGLVRAYTEAAKVALESLPTELKIERRLVGIETPYSFYESLKRLIHTHQGQIEEEDFAAEITILARFPVVDIDPFTRDVSDATAGRVAPIVFDE